MKLPKTEQKRKPARLSAPLAEPSSPRGIELPQLPSNPLSLELLDTPRCLALSPQINEFENEVFGPDFFCRYEMIRPWVESECLFYAAVCGEAVTGFKRILSVASILLTSQASMERMLRGEIPDYELVPWLRCAECSLPVAYFASIISDNPEHLASMYEALGHDVEKYLQTHNLTVDFGFSIAAGAAGLRHLSKSGFTVLEGKKYLQKYDLMIIDASMARTQFWRRLFRSRSAPAKAA